GVRSGPIWATATSVWPTGSLTANVSSTAASATVIVVVPSTAGTNVNVPRMPLPAGPNGSVPAGGGAPRVTQFCRIWAVLAVLPGEEDGAKQMTVRPVLPRNGPRENTGGEGEISVEYC